jgi:GNAT superfamily N-acetyltransferase
MITIHQASNEQELETARTLIRDFVAWSRETYHDHLDVLEKYFAPVEAELATLPGAYAPPDGRLLLASVDGSPAGVVALRPLEEGVCEMKRMYVDPRFHGQGLGHALATRLLAEARLAGYRRMWLETGPRQHAARRLYQRLGFRPIGPYYPFPDDFPDEIKEGALFMELHL